MPLNLSTVATLFRTELRMLVRDRRTLVTSILLPLLLTPVMLLGVSWMNRAREKKLQETVYRYAITGTAADEVRSFVAAARAHHAEKSPGSAAAFKFEEVSPPDPITALAQGTIHFYLEGLTPDAMRTERAAPSVLPPSGGEEEANNGGDPVSAAPPAPETEPENWREPLVDGAPVVRLVFRGDRDDSGAGMHRMRTTLQEARHLQRATTLQARGFPVAPHDVAAIKATNLASAGHVAGLALGRGITLFVLLFLMSGCAVVATDSLAGEKERGTLETLLTTAATRLEIIIAKHLAVFAVAITIALIQAGNLLAYVGLELIPISANLVAAVPPPIVLLLLVLFLPLAALAASVLLLTSGYAKSYKEAQLYFTPVFFIGVVLAFASFLPDLPLRSAIVMLPVANIAVAAREILVGSFDWTMIAIAWLVTAGAAAGATHLSVRFLAAEKLITATESDAIDFAGGPALFGRHVGRWFAVMWALLLIISNYTAPFDPRLQITINLVGLFLGAALLMLRWYRLPVREALALRSPRPVVWLAVIVAVPSAILSGLFVLYLANLLFPMPADMIEEMTKAFRFEDLPAWQLILFVGVLPGLCEEITFRGLLLHGLHRRLHPALLIVVVGLVFGLFHVTLPRILPTAYIGLLLTAVVLLTGSIYPAMLWHAASNSLMLLYGERLLGATPTIGLYSSLGAVALAACFWIIWRHRTPYPGLRPWRRPR